MNQKKSISNIILFIVLLIFINLTANSLLGYAILNDIDTPNNDTTLNDTTDINDTTYSINSANDIGLKKEIDIQIEELINQFNETNTTLSIEAESILSKLNESYNIENQLLSDGIGAQRYSDLVYLIKQLFLAKLTLELNNNVADYSDVNQKLNELDNIKYQAYLCLDELTQLNSELNRSYDINISPAYSLYNLALKEFKDERYELCLEKIDETYSKIAELESTKAKLIAFSAAVSRNIINFLNKNKYYIFFLVVIILILYLLLHKQLYRYKLKKKLFNLKLRKETIKQLIADTQRDYFEKNKISEQQYNVRIKKFGALIRDINRQIPLIREEIEKTKSKLGEKKQNKQKKKQQKK